MILHLRFVRGMTQAEIAQRLGISQMHVSRLLAKSLNQLRGLAEAPSKDGPDDASKPTRQRGRTGRGPTSPGGAPRRGGVQARVLPPAEREGPGEAASDESGASVGSRG